MWLLPDKDVAVSVNAGVWGTLGRWHTFVGREADRPFGRSPAPRSHGDLGWPVRMYRKSRGETIKSRICISSCIYFLLCSKNWTYHQFYFNSFLRPPTRRGPLFLEVFKLQGDLAQLIWFCPCWKCAFESSFLFNWKYDVRLLISGLMFKTSSPNGVVDYHSGSRTSRGWTLIVLNC